MGESSDQDLLGQFVRQHSEAAFAELARRHVNLVYSAALRQLGGDPHTAEDVVQMVFAELARQAKVLEKHPLLAGWIYTTTRRMAGHVRRGRQRREHREQEIFAMQNQLPTDESAYWLQLRDVLDEAMHELSEADRRALLARFFEGRKLRRVGEALGLSENAARMRVQRALERLRAILARKGVTTSVAGLAACLAANAVTAAPAALLATAAGASALAAGGIASLGGLTTKTLLIAMKSKLGFAAAVILASAPLVFQQFQIRDARAELKGLRNGVAELSELRIRAAQAEAKRLDLEELATLRRDEAELARLKQETQNLLAKSGSASPADWAKAESELRKAQAERELELETDKAIRKRSIIHAAGMNCGLAARIFATDNQDRLPENMEQIIMAMQKEDRLTREEAEQRAMPFEIYPQPRIVAEAEPGIFFFREKSPRPMPNGQWERFYGYADGSVRNTVLEMADFAAWEQQSHGIASPATPSNTTNKYGITGGQ